MHGYEDCRTCEGRGTLDIRGYWGCDDCRKRRSSEVNTAADAAITAATNPILTAYHAAKSGAPLSELDGMLSSALPYQRPAIKAAIIRGTIDHLRESGVPETDAMLAGLVGCGRKI